MLCRIDNCDNPILARGLCRKHYLRWYKHGNPETVLINQTAPGDVQRWMASNSAHPDAEKCLIFPFNKGAGRGQFWLDGKTTTASRMMCELAHGPAPTERHHAAHSCKGNGTGCVNQNHLRWATPEENEADKGLHGTKLQGEIHHRAKLTEPQAREILISPLPPKELAGIFGISADMVRRIKARKNWSHL